MSDLQTLKRIVAAYQEDTARRQTTDGVHYYHVQQTNPNVNDIIKWLEDNEAQTYELPLKSTLDNVLEGFEHYIKQTHIPGEIQPLMYPKPVVKRFIKARYTSKSAIESALNGAFSTGVSKKQAYTQLRDKLLEDNEAWYSIEPRTVTIEVKDES